MSAGFYVQAPSLDIAMVANGMKLSPVWQFDPAPSFIYSSVLCMRWVREFGQILKLFSEWVLLVIRKIDKLGSLHSDRPGNHTATTPLELAAQRPFQSTRASRHANSVPRS